MASILGRNGSVYWSGARVDKTRNAVTNLASDTKEDTAHGATNKSFAPTFPNSKITVTGLYNTGAAAAGNSAQIINDALAQNLGYWSIYMGSSNQYLYGSGYVSVDNVAIPYDDFSPFNWSIIVSGAVGVYAK